MTTTTVATTKVVLRTTQEVAAIVRQTPKSVLRVARRKGIKPKRMLRGFLFTDEQVDQLLSDTPPAPKPDAPVEAPAPPEKPTP